MVRVCNVLTADSELAILTKSAFFKGVIADGFKDTRSETVTLHIWVAKE